jgi:hypothetical protein
MILYKEAMYLVRDRFLDQGWARFKEDETGVMVLVIQAESDGRCPKMVEALAAGFWPELVICCYPASAQAKYPDLVFLGAEIWDGAVVVDWFPNCCRVKGVS